MRRLAGLFQFAGHTSSSLTNQRGFALAEVIVALALLSAVLAGLMTSVQYARQRAVANYHDRYVLLRVDGELQRLKYYYTRDGYFPSLAPITFNIPQLNARSVNEGKQLPVVVTFHTDDYPDITVADNIRYIALTAIAEWDEHLPLSVKNKQREKRYVQLREDYFYERSTP